MKAAMALDAIVCGAGLGVAIVELSEAREVKARWLFGGLALISTIGLVLAVSVMFVGE